MSLVFEQCVNGLTLGGMYALVALGYTLVYGVLRMVNFAHSELFMLGAVGGYGALALWPGSPSPLALPVVFLAATAVSGVAALVLDRVAYLPVRRSSRLTPLLSAIGASLFLQNAVFLWRDGQMAFPALLPSAPLSLLGVSVMPAQILIVAVSVVCMGALALFVRASTLGKAMRAVSQDAETAELMGIPVNRVIAVTFFIGGALGGVAGVLNGFYYGSIKYNMGFTPGLKAFTAAVLGGIGNVPGAMAGGFILGFIEVLGAGFLPSPEWKDVTAFLVLILILLFRPAGLFGKNVPEKL